MAGNSTPYYGTIPTIAQAYQNDPRSKLAASALALGTSTAPVAQGGWAMTDGAARAAQALVGAFINKKQEAKYGAREQAYVQGMQDAAKIAGAPQPGMNPATVDPAMNAAAGALAGGAPPASPAPPMAPMPSPAPSLPAAPGSAPMGGPNPAGGPMMTAGLSMPSGGALGTPQTGGLPDPTRGGTGPSRGASRGVTGRDIQLAALSAVPGAVVTSGARTAAHNKAVGGVANSYHLTDQARDLVPPQGMSMRAFHRALKQQAPEYQWINEGDHIHGEPLSRGQQYAQAYISQPGTRSDSVPNMEAVPELPAAPSAQAPGAPQRPAEVASNRIPMAQALLQSGNPDLMAIAQTYLDKGLDEQNEARRLSSQQEFQQEQTGYSANLADWQNARSDSRQNAYTEHRDANQRNFTRETNNTQNTFQAGEAAKDRSFRTSERAATQAFQAAQQASQNGFNASESALERQNRLDVAGIRKGPQADRDRQHSAYFNTPTGLKMQQKAGEEIDANNNAINKYSRFMDLNSRQNTGGAALNTPGIAAAYRWSNSDLTEMNALANDTTLAAIGGSLGTAISDGDRKFISDSNINTSNPRRANTNIARARVGALRRKNDYIVEFANAQADGTQASFAQDWSKFAQAAPVVQYDAKGNAIANDKPLTFSQWRASRPRYDANGKRVN